MKRLTSTLALAVAICSPLASAAISTAPSKGGVAIVSVTSDDSNCAILRFDEIPIIEGKLYVSVTCGANNILLSATEVESETVILPVNLSDYVGKEIGIKAFQDLNDNRKLDFDSYGRPTEPCLQTKVTVDSKETVIPLKLIQY